MRRLAALLCLLLAPAIAAAEGWTLDDLLSARRAVSEARAEFSQERYSLLLEAPLRSTGKLHYRAPNYLAQEISAPFASRMSLDGDTLTLWRDGQQQQLSLRRHPRAGLYASALRGVLSGRLDGLDEHFEISLSGEQQAWQLTLSPRDNPFAEDDPGARFGPAVPHIEIRGQGERLQRIELRPSPAERTLMIIHQTPP